MYRPRLAPLVAEWAVFLYRNHYCALPAFLDSPKARLVKAVATVALQVFQRTYYSYLPNTEHELSH